MPCEEFLDGAPDFLLTAPNLVCQDSPAHKIRYAPGSVRSGSGRADGECRDLESRRFGMAITATRPPRVGKWTEPALRVLRERYLTREGDRAQETPEEMCWRVAVAIARAEERWGKSPAAVHEIACAFYDMMVDATVPAELADPHERGQGQPAPVLGLLRPPGRRLHGGDLRRREGRGHHPQVGRRHRLRLLAPPPEGRPRALDRRPGLGPRVLPAGVQRRRPRR